MSGSRRRGAIEIREDSRRRALQQQDVRGVEDVLARRTPVHVTRRIAIDRLDLLRQVTDQRNGEHAVGFRFRCDRLEVVSLGTRRRTNGSSGFAGNDAELRLDFGERGFDVEHRLKQIDLVRHRRRRFRRRPASRD